MLDLDLVTANGPLRVFSLLHDARPVLLTWRVASTCFLKLFKIVCQP